MYERLCMYVFMYGSKYIYMQCVYVCTCLRMYVCEYACALICVWFMYLCMFVWM